jgi:hypothetical protein
VVNVIRRCSSVERVFCVVGNYLLVYVHWHNRGLKTHGLKSWNAVFIRKSKVKSSLANI